MFRYQIRPYVTAALFLLFFACIFSLFPGGAPAQDMLDVRQTMSLSALGDGKATADFKWSPEYYRAIKERFPTPELFVSRFLTPDKFEAEPRNIRARYDDKFFRRGLRGYY